ncbi:DUF5050 domain-containing protein [Lysinibacillus sp. NPDC093190]|uniref:DUF5050 domain-containing protein n=1 Tax=Lysinibacillus sp. NPDC093190 TaxID=3390575 RepID=UPI003D0602B1
MSLLFYEMKKMFLYQKGLLMISLFFIINIGIIMIFDTPKNQELEINSSQYSYYLDQVNGPYSDELEQFFTNESNRISDAKVALNKIYNDYYDGNISENEFNTLSGPLENKVKNESGFNLIFKQYMFIKEKPENRYFLSTNGWDGLLSNDRIDFLFLLLLLILVTPVFCSEFTSEMDVIHLTVKKGAKLHTFTKISLVLMTVIILSLLTSLIRYGFFQVKYGLENGDYPLQSLAYFATSQKKITLFSTFLWTSVIKTFGNLSFSVVIMFCSVWIKKYAFTIFFSTAAIVIPYFGFSLASSKYFLPGPLGFMASTGFFRGNEHEYNRFTNQMTVKFEEISLITIFILFVITLCFSIAAISYIFHKHSNTWNKKKRWNFLRLSSIISIFCLVMTNLVGCSPFKEDGEKDVIYNDSTRQSFENENYRFYVNETDLEDIKIVFENKKNKETGNFIRNPIQSLTKIENSLFGNGSLVYYMKYDYEKSGFYKELTRFSVIEVDTTTFSEKVIFEKSIDTKSFSLVGLNKKDHTDLYFYNSIKSFFLNEKNIYFVDQDKISRVDRLTGKIKVIITYPRLKNVAFDGKKIYYLNEKNQIVQHDTSTDSEKILSDIITTYFILTDTELVFLNRKDQNKIYVMNLNSFKIKKITETSVASFTCNDQYIYYENKNSSEKYRIGRDGQNNTLIVN